MPNLPQPHLNNSSQDELVSAFASIERRIKRERAARKEAERLLSQKSLELYTAKEKSDQAQQQLALALWAGRESVWQWDDKLQQFTIRFFHELEETIRTFRGNESDILTRVHPDDQELARLNWHMLLSGSSDSLDIVYRFRSQSISLTGSDTEGKRSQWRWYHCRGQLVTVGENSTKPVAMGTIKDITEQRQTEDSLRIMAKAFSSSREAMLVISASWQLIEANDAFHQLTGMENQPLEPFKLTHFLEVSPQQQKAVSRKKHLAFETTLFSRPHKTIPVEVSFTRYHGKKSGRPNLIVTIRDISERKQAENALQHMARHDALTNLPNRGNLTETLEPEISNACPQNKLGLMFIDLDSFQAVNEEFGHIAADSALVTIARRLSAKMPESAMVARWGGDEFVVSFWQLFNSQQDLPAIAIESIREPVTIAGSEVRLTASIGVALCQSANMEANELIRRSDTAMYQAKRAGKNQVCYYQDSREPLQSGRVSLVSALVSALEHDELDFYVQPKFDQHRRIVGGEMLARWNSPSRGPISPGVFIPLIEQNGLNLAFSEAVFRAGTQYAACIHRINPDLHLSINLSAWQMIDPQLVHKLLTHCHTQGVPPSAIELEITESVFMQPEAEPVGVMGHLKDCGFRLAIDDFGTGYSSLSYLRNLPLDIVKIDRSFVIDADRSERARKILSAIIRMSHDLGMSVVAEGIETEEHWQLLTELDVELFQGFLLARPCPFEEYHKMIATHSPGIQVNTDSSQG